VPEDAPLAMPTQALQGGSLRNCLLSAWPWLQKSSNLRALNFRYHRRRLLFFLLTLLTTGGALTLLIPTVEPGGITVLEYALLSLYAALSCWIAGSFWTAILGAYILLRGRDPWLIQAPETFKDFTLDGSFKTAVIMPIFNEDPRRVFAGLRAMYASLKHPGPLEGFEFFVLSDTRDTEIRLHEQAQWRRLCADLDAEGRVFYRHRPHNIARKSGNIADFCKRFGGRYRYMIILDADSLMEGATMLELVRRMEAKPKAGVIQAPSMPQGHESLFARLQQFAANVYGPLTAAGVNFWQLGECNFWGHNAIVRVEAFAASCGLPELPGRAPFGGPILSHDFVEAALLRRGGWQVWLAYDLRGSYEEMPTNVIDYAKRDRRWCQGNLQHFPLIFARGFHGMNRLHLAAGIMSYVAAPLWFIFLAAATADAYVKSQEKIEYFFGYSLFPVWPVSHGFEMFVSMLIVLTMLVLPKLLALLVAIVKSRPERIDFGHSLRLTASVFIETIFSLILAPGLMFLQSKFVLAALMRRSVGWPAQQRRDQQTSLREALRAHGDQGVVGVLLLVGANWWFPSGFWWLAPVAIALILAVPLSVITSRLDAGRMARQLGLFLIPAEVHCPPVLSLLREHWQVLSAASRVSRIETHRVRGRT
jgi:membrane glycosyltransferase